MFSFSHVQKLVSSHLFNPIMRIRPYFKASLSKLVRLQGLWVTLNDKGYEKTEIFTCDIDFTCVHCNVIHIIWIFISIGRLLIVHNEASTCCFRGYRLTCSSAEQGQQQTKQNWVCCYYSAFVKVDDFCLRNPNNGLQSSLMNTFFTSVVYAHTTILRTVLHV